MTELAQSCDRQSSERKVRQKSMTEELPTIHETIKLLNDDDVLELFKGTLMQALQGTESFGQTDDEARVSGHQGTGMRPLTATISCPTWVRVSMPCRKSISELDASLMKATEIRRKPASDRDQSMPKEQIPERIREETISVSENVGGNH